MKTATSIPKLDRGRGRSFPAGRIELLNVHWHDLRGERYPPACALPAGASVGRLRRVAGGPT